MIEMEVQNEILQTLDRLRFAVVPRIGEGLRLRGPDGIWASYDVLDLWVPYLHVRMPPGEEMPELPSNGIAFHKEREPYTI